MTEAMAATDLDQKLAEVPMGSGGEPEKWPRSRCFFASDLSSYMTGTVLEVTVREACVTTKREAVICETDPHADRPLRAEMFKSLTAVAWVVAALKGLLGPHRHRGPVRCKTSSSATATHPASARDRAGGRLGRRAAGDRSRHAGRPPLRVGLRRSSRRACRLPTGQRRCDRSGARA